MAAQNYSIVIDLRWCLDELLADKVIDQRGYNLVITSRRNKAQHPLLTISEFGLPNGHALDGNSDNKLTLAWLNQWLAAKADMPLVRIDPLKVDVPAVTQLMSFEYARSQYILPIEVTLDEVVIGTDQPFYTDWHSNIEKLIKSKSYRTVYINPEQINRYRQEFYQVTQAIAGANSVHKRAAADVTNVEALLQLGDNTNPDANDQHIVRVVDWLLQYAFEQRASDIHLEPRRETGKVRFRIDGVLHNVYEFPEHVGVAVTSRLRILGRLNVAEKRRPQDGRIKTRRSDDSEVELRLSTLPTAFGEKLVLRIFDPDVLLRSFADLGLVGEDYERWRGMLERPNGIVLVTGPTGSGKTTTLYSSLRQIATEEVNVSTIEDPIEMVEEHFNQTQVHHKIGLDFAAGIRTLMRQDPDIIMVGEIRDLETAQMAVQAALTGHLVLSTVHTNDAPATVARLLDLGIPPYLINATLLGVMAQRLVRTLCPHCKEEGEISSEDWQQLVTPWKVSVPQRIYRPVGCLECRNTGYLGRQGLYEILLLSESVKDRIGTETSLGELRKQAMREGMRTLRLSGAQKVAAGLTTVEEVMRVAPPPEKER
jgi:general secretion pathway protein E